MVNIVLSFVCSGDKCGLKMILKIMMRMNHGKLKCPPSPLIWRLPTPLSLCRWWSTWINIINTIINTIIIINIINILKPMHELEDEHIKIEFWIAKARRCNVLGNYPGRRGGKKLRWMITQFAGGTGPRGKKWDSGLRSVFFRIIIHPSNVFLLGLIGLMGLMVLTILSLLSLVNNSTFYCPQVVSK